MAKIMADDAPYEPLATDLTPEQVLAHAVRAEEDAVKWAHASPQMAEMRRRDAERLRAWARALEDSAAGVNAMLNRVFG